MKNYSDDTLMKIPLSLQASISEPPGWLCAVNELWQTMGPCSLWHRGCVPPDQRSYRPVAFCQAVRQMKLHSIRPNRGCHGAQPDWLQRPQGLGFNCPLVAFAAKMPPLYDGRGAVRLSCSRKSCFSSERVCWTLKVKMEICVPNDTPIDYIL